jgi:hypothetical protein
MNDDLRNRITNIDPMHPGVPTQSTTSESSQELLEKIMSTPLKEKSEPAPAPRKTWAIGIAAVAALVLAVAAGIGLTSGGDDPAVAAPLELDAGGEDVMASCIMFSSAELEKVAEIAFAGTVTAVDGDAVTLTVDEWYRGGDSAEAVLNAPQGMEALIGGIPFQVGDAYLISAQGGNVNYCGFSGPLSPEYQAAFEEAFG